MNLKLLRLIYINYFVLMLYTIYGVVTKISLLEYIKTLFICIFFVSILVILIGYIYETIFFEEKIVETKSTFEQNVGADNQEDIKKLLDEMSQPEEQIQENNEANSDFVVSEGTEN